jgi:hypothetical protein
MIEVHDGLYVGGDSDCVHGGSGLSVVHACKDPCHRIACGDYKGSLPRSNEDYLWKEIGMDLYLNIIDPPVPLFMMETFDVFLRFAGKFFIPGINDLLIHCNRGLSRAPSLAMLFMSKGLGVLPDNWPGALSGFMKIYPSYCPGLGITEWLRCNWGRL